MPKSPLHFLLTIVILLPFTLILLFTSCKEEKIKYAAAIENRDSLPVLRSIGVSTLISDSGIISYRIIAEEWFMYDKKNPQYWSFEKGLFMEKFDKDMNIEAYLNCDTAYYYTDIRLWELRGRVSVRNSRNETFKTSKLFWDQHKKLIYSDAYMEIKGIDRDLSGYDFYSNEQMTDYEIHSTRGSFPVSEEKSKPRPDPHVMTEMRDTSQVSEKTDSVRKPLDSTVVPSDSSTTKKQ